MNKLLEIDRTIPVPLYYQLKENLKKSIKKNFAVGDKFYSERQLAEILSVSRIASPPLTTVRFDKAKLAEVSMKHLMAKIDRKSNRCAIERIPVELIIRESVANILANK